MAAVAAVSPQGRNNRLVNVGLVLLAVAVFIAYRRLTRPRGRMIHCIQCGRPTGQRDESGLGDSSGYCSKCITKLTGGRVRVSARDARVVRSEKERGDRCNFARR